MRTLFFRPTSVVELAAHVIPEFNPFVLLIQSDSGCDDELKLNDSVMLDVNLPDNQEAAEIIRGTVVFRFEIKNLEDWVAVAISTDQQALIHRISYLCRQHTDEYGRLFSQLINNFSHSH